MRISSLRFGIKVQEHQRKEDVLRGYNPLREIYHWHLIISLLIGGTYTVILALSPIGFFNSLSQIEINSWSPYLSTFSIITWLGSDLILILFSFFRGYQNEQKKRNTMRRAALMGNSLTLVPTQPLPLHTPIFLQHIKTHLKKKSIQQATIMVILLASALCLSYAPLVNLRRIPFFLSLLAPFSLIMIIFLWLIGKLSLVQITAGHYLLPSLRIDESGITAHYGRDTISMRWSDVRYFALVNSTTFSRATLRKASEYEAFEVCDGENMICWLTATPFSSYHLYLPDGTALSDQDYANFTWQLASLIVDRTNLPLSDFRLPLASKRKRKPSREIDRS